MGAISFFKSLYRFSQEYRRHNDRKPEQHGSALSASGPSTSDLSMPEESQSGSQEYKDNYSGFTVSLAVEDIGSSVAFLRQVLQDSNAIITEALHNEFFDVRLADGSDGGPVVRFENRGKGNLFADEGPTRDAIKDAIQNSGIRLSLQVGSMDSLRTALSKLKAQWEDVADATAVRFLDHEYVTH